MRCSRVIAAVAVSTIAVMPFAYLADASVPVGTQLSVTPVGGSLPPGDAVPQAASVAGTGDGSSVVYFAGNEEETWTFSPGSSTWTEHPASGPTTRQGAAAAPLAGGGTRTLLYGGFGPGEEYFDETWEFDTVTGVWVMRCGPCAPGGLARSMMASSPTTTLLFGGSTTFGFNNDVWRWDDAASDWVKLTPSAPDELPFLRGDGQFAFDGTNFVLYGGVNGSYVTLDDAWLLVDDGDGAWRWQFLCTGCPPGPRALGAFAQLGGAGTPAGALLFGGENFDSHNPGVVPTYSDGWFFDGADHTWTQVIQGVPPTPATDDPDVPYGPTLGTFGQAGQPLRLVLTATRYDTAGDQRTESNVLAWQVPSPPTTTTSSTSPASSTSTIPSTTPTAAPVVAVPRFTG